MQIQKKFHAVIVVVIKKFLVVVIKFRKFETPPAKNFLVATCVENTTAESLEHH